MTAVGKNSGKQYKDEDIFTSLYFEMIGEPLHALGEPERIVIPVRRKDAPHFRDLSKGAREDIVGRRENDSAHEDCIDYLMQLLKNRRIKLGTNVFVEDQMRPQIFFTAPASPSYEWWRAAGDCRIPIGDGRLIVPDICGRNPQLFAASLESRSIIIEVVRTHSPEMETYFHLLKLSSQNHIVVFYFIPILKKSSKFNRYSFDSDFITILPAYYMLDGQFYSNGIARPVKISPQEHFQYVTTTYFENAMREAA